MKIVHRLPSLAMATVAFTAVLCLIAPVPAAHADSINLNTLVMNGSATPSGSSLQLINGGFFESSSAWLATPISSSSSWNSSFTFSLTNDGLTPQADGIAFVVQSSGTSNLGQTGGFIGLDGLTGNTVAAVFQSYANNNVGLVTNSDPYTANDAHPNLGGANSDTGTVDVSYNAGTDQMTLSGNLLLDGSGFTIPTQTIDINLANFLGPQVFLGFTGGAGGSNSQELINTWNLTTSSPVPEPRTLLLLGTGLAVAAVIARRRIAKLKA